MMPQSILITGASRGLGAALAEAFAAPGVRLFLNARSGDALEAAAGRCRDKGAEAFTAIVDVTDPQAMRQWMAEADAMHPLDMAIANAGIFAGKNAAGALEPPAAVQALVRTNLEGAINMANAAAPLMQRRRRGRLVFISSLAALHPLADAPVYSAAKAGLAAYSEALRDYLRPSGVAVTLVLPGHIRTRQTAHHAGLTPFLMEAEQAGEIIIRGLMRGRDVIAFPRRLLWMIRLARLAPPGLRAALNRPFRFHIADD